jgi:hypothetical protein
VSFEFSINLARAEVERFRMEQTKLRMVTVCFAVFGLLFLGTFAAYLQRNGQIALDRRQMGIYATAASKQGITPEKVGALKRQSFRFQAQLSILRQIVWASASWSSSLTSLAQYCRQEDIRLRKIEGRTREEIPLMIVEGSCPVEDAMSRIHRLMRVVSRSGSFGFGRVLSIRDDARRSRVAFKLEVPLLKTGLTSAATARQGDSDGL